VIDDGFWYRTLTGGDKLGIWKKWSEFKKDNVDREGNVYGAYEFGDRDGEVIYVGHGLLRQRLMSHFLDSGSHVIPGAAFYRVEQVGGKERAEQRERSLIREYMRSHGGMCPRHNKRFG